MVAIRVKKTVLPSYFDPKPRKSGVFFLVESEFCGRVSGVEHLVNRDPATFDELDVIRGRNKARKSFRPFGHRSVEWRFGICLQQNRYPRVGYVV